jgi:ATP-binding cassette subfamily B protein
MLWLSIGLAVVTACMSLTRPYLMRYAIDRGALAGNPRVLFWGGLGFAGVIVGEQLINFVQVYAVQISGARAMSDLRRHVFAFLQGRKLAFFDRQPVGRLVTRVTNDIDAILELFASGALDAIVDLLKLVGIVTVMVALDWRLSLIGFAAAPVVAVLVSLVRRRSREAFRAIRAKTAQMNANMNEQVSGMAVVQAFCREDAAAHEFDVINGAYRDANIKSIKYEAIQDAAIEMVTSVCLASIVVSLGYRPVSFGTVVAFNAYLLMFFEPISALAQRYTLLQSAMAGAERVFGLLDIDESDAPKRADAAPSSSTTTAFSFEHVSFEYKPGVPALRDVTFSVRRGEKIAVVGPTGAGKTTLASLLLRLYDATDGVVRVEGRDVVGMDRLELRRRFSVVPQDVFLFPGTVASNVALGDTKPDRAKVEAALRRIDAYDLFMRRPDGIDAKVGERGDNFSAGERQLIAFARALYRDAPILMLDEATASIDSETESRIQRALDELMKGRTALIIAHRLSTVRAADRILGFQRGRLVEQGTHQELLRAGGLYAKLHRLHFARASEAVATHVEATGA